MSSHKAMPTTLYSMWRATAPYRVRIGLALKGLPYDYVALDFAGGEQRSEAYRAVNPQALSPTLEVDGERLTQSLAILEWLEETHPDPALLPRSPRDRATVRAMAQIVACDIHPLNNLRVLQALDGMGHPLGGAEQLAWAQRWIIEGFTALEPMVAKHGAGFAFGETPSLADCLITPQLWACERWKVDLGRFPALASVYARTLDHPAFQSARPERQPDAPRA